MHPWYDSHSTNINFLLDERVKNCGLSMQKNKKLYTHKQFKVKFLPYIKKIIKEMVLHTHS